MEEISEIEGSQNIGKTEGWLYLVRFNRLGLQYTRKRYFVLENNLLNCFKSQPTSKNEGCIRSAFIDSCIRVKDNGRENINKNDFFIFTLYNSSKPNDQLKLGARSSEEMAIWIHSLQKSASKECPDRDQKNSTLPSTKRRWPPFRLNRNRRRACMSSVDWTVFSSINQDPFSSDVIAPSTWTIFGCKNGLRLFKETNCGDLTDSHGKSSNAHPAIMAVGVVDATSEEIFRTVMSLGSSRSEWDFCFGHASIVEHLDGHTDIVNKQLKEEWLPWGMRRRDFLFHRYWRREDDGTYVILYHSVLHEKCRPRKGFVRACLKSGGYVIFPIKRGKKSVVKHMLAIDWKFWRSCFFNSTEKYITINMLGKIAALRELFKAKLENRGPTINDIEEMIIPTPVPIEEETVKLNNDDENNICGSLVQLNDAASDVFFDVPEQSETNDPFFHHAEQQQQDQKQTPRLPTPADFVKKLHSLAAQRKFNVALHDTSGRTGGRCNYGTTLPKDLTSTTPCSWTEADPSSFLIRGKNYLKDHHKVKAKSSLMKMVAADWLNSDKREDNLGSRPSGIVQKYATKGGNEFFIIINIQVPGTTNTHNLALYYLINTPIKNVPLLQSFVNGDDAYRNSRFKLIPYIPKGSWIVKQSVGKKACLVGQALEINYFHGTNYLELGIDIGSSTVARGVVNLVLGYINNLVIEMAFLIQADNAEELPEMLLGTCQLNHLDIAKSFSVES